MKTLSANRLIIILSVVLLSFPAAAENGKFYTKKALLEDFTARMTKVVLTGDAVADAVIREETTTRWNLSPYEFCTIGEYGGLKENPNYYFIHFVEDGDVLFMTLDHGGTKDDPDIRKRFFEVVSIPVSGMGRQGMENLEYMAAFIDIIQEFVEMAMASDSNAYSGLKVFERSTLGKRICLDRERAVELFDEGAPDVLVGITVSSGNPRPGSICYKMLVSSDTHELYYFRKHKITENRPAGWLEVEKCRFNGISAE